MDELLTWTLQNLSNIGIVGLLTLFVILLINGQIVLGPLHKRECKTGDDAIAVLDKLNPRLAELETLAAVQKVRDEYGRKEADDLRGRLNECLAERDRCWQQRRQDASENPR